jgi:hypothetical protein
MQTVAVTFQSTSRRTNLPNKLSYLKRLLHASTPFVYVRLLVKTMCWVHGIINGSYNAVAPKPGLSVRYILAPRDVISHDSAFPGSRAL